MRAPSVTAAAPAPSLLAAGIGGRMGLAALVVGGLWVGLLATLAS